VRLFRAGIIASHSWVRSWASVSKLTLTMNSPPDPGSPSPSTPSSGSPPPEEANFQPQSNAGYLSNLTSHISATFGGSGASKRRLPAGASFGAASSTRDAKTRKRTTENRSNSQYDGPRDPAMKKEKDELIDNSTVEWLRKGMALTSWRKYVLTY